MPKPEHFKLAGFQVRPDYLTGYCQTCGTLLGDIDAHDRWHAAQEIGGRDA